MKAQSFGLQNNSQNFKIGVKLMQQTFCLIGCGKSTNPVPSLFSFLGVWLKIISFYGFALHYCFFFIRYLSLPTLQKAQTAVIFNFILCVFLFLMVGWLGMVMYAVYNKCDPMTTKQVRTRDQLLPLHVLHVAGDYPGIPGLFMVGVFRKTDHL